MRPLGHLGHETVDVDGDKAVFAGMSALGCAR